MILVPGKITVAVPGTPVNLYAQLDPSFYRFKSYHAILLQALHDNSGRIYIGGVGMNKTTRAACAAVLAVPSSGSIPSFGIANTIAPAAVDLSALWIDADDADDGVLCTLLVT